MTCNQPRMVKANDNAQQQFGIKHLISTIINTGVLQAISMDTIGWLVVEHATTNDELFRMNLTASFICKQMRIAAITQGLDPVVAETKVASLEDSSFNGC